MGMVTVWMEYVIVYMDILEMDVRFHQTIHLIHVMGTLFAMAMVLVLGEKQYVIVYMDILGTDVRYLQRDLLQLIHQIHVIVTLFAMAMVLVPTEDQYVIVYMDILGMDVRFHQLHLSPIHLKQQKNQTMTLIQIKLIVKMYQLTPTQSG